MSGKGTKVLSKMKSPSEVDRKSCDELSGRSQLLPETQCISKILKNCIRQAEIAATLPALLKLSSVSDFADREFSRALQQHQILTERLEVTRQVSDGEQEIIVVKKRAQLERNFQDSVRNLLRLVRAHPDVISDLKAEQNVEVGKNESVLIYELKRFCSQMVEKLQTCVRKELELPLHKPVSSPSFAPQILDLLNPEDEKLTAAVKEKDAEILEQNAKIAALQKSLEELNKETTALSISGEKQPMAPVKTSKMIQIEQEMDQLNAQLSNIKLERRQAEGIIQEKNKKLEKEIECLLQSFDEEIGKIQARLDAAVEGYEKEMEELKTQETPFSILEAEYNQILERNQLEEDKRLQDIRDQELRTKAAIYAQSWWRGYKVRKALKGNKGKSKKPTKGKGKKK